MLQKIKKYALPLLLLQFVLTIAVGFYLQNQLDKSVEQKEDFIDLLSHSFQVNSVVIRAETMKSTNRMEWKSKTEQVGQSYLEAALGIERYTYYFTQDIDDILFLENENSQIEYLDMNEIAAKHKDTVLQIMENIHGNLDSQERAFAEEIYNCYTISNSKKMTLLFDQVKDKKTYWIYLRKIRNDLYLIENELTNYLKPYVFNSSRLMYGYYPHIVASKNKLLEGETLALDISLSNRVINKGDCVFVIGKDTLQMDREKAVHYQIVLNKLGIHELKVKFVCDKGYSYDFAHKYEVASKRQP